MYFNFINKYKSKIILYFSILFFLPVSVSAFVKDNFLVTQKKRVKELAFKISDIEMALCKNEMAKKTIYLSWMTYIFFFITADKKITCKNSIISFIAGGWLGTSISWYSYLVSDSSILKEKNIYLKKELEDAQLSLSIHEPLNIESA